ncbi:protein FAM198B-like [Labeo rohita]|uniref:Protein FAM198B-like n=1 Tax=Labeo rohita TaxID=84645 RepID=A0A498LGS8_LABRO|nr:protein FAM198B-like [Labeo rohita]
MECFFSGFAVQLYGLLDWLWIRCFAPPELILPRCSEEHFGPLIYLSGNITAVPVVKFIGLGLGILLWGSSGLLIGWASSSAIIFFFVKSDVQKRSSTESMPLLIDDRRLNPDSTSPSDSWVDTISPKSKRVFGCILAIFSGVLYGSSFVPVFYIKVHATNNSSMFTGSSQNEIDYCFAHYSGIFLMSTVYFLAYCAVMKNRPRIYPRAILPGFLSGLMWGLATYAWLMANYYLSAVITFPIINAGYGLVAALWGSVVFKEVKVGTWELAAVCFGILCCSGWLRVNCLFKDLSLRTSARQDKRSELWNGNSVYSQSKTDQDLADGEVNDSVSPTRSNVVYITLKSKRHKPAIIRGTVRPKLRRKKVKVRQQGGTQGKAKDAVHNTNTVNKRLGYAEIYGSDIGYSSIRIYSEKAPPWFSYDDITAMRFLADSKITQIDEVTPPGFSSFILFKSATNGTDDVEECHKCYGIVKRPLDMSEVFAFHLDRILGLNRTLPAVSRRFHSLGGTIYERLDKNCCGFKPRPEDTCVELGHHEECKDKDSTELTHIIHRKHDPHHLVFFNNKGYFDRDEENLNFRLLEGIKELPDQSVSVLKSQRLREKLLQSLFLDQQYWDSQGGRQGIEKLIDVIERRAKVLLTYINAHGIKVVPMNS